MKTTIEILEALKTKNDGASDYRIAKILDISVATVSVWRTGKGSFNDSTAIKIAKILEVEPGQILAAAHAERAKNDSERMVWDDIYKRLGGMAAALILVFGLVAAPSDVQANQRPNASECALC